MLPNCSLNFENANRHVKNNPHSLFFKLTALHQRASGTFSFAIFDNHFS